MPWNLNGKRKTNSNMMCKVLCFCCCCIFILTDTITAFAEEDIRPETTDILLIYDEGNIKVSEDDIEQFCTLTSSLGKSLTFGDVKDFEGSLAKYEYVICYRLEEISANEMKVICNYKGSLMILGSEFMKRYLNETGHSDLILQESTQDKGVLHYAFSGGDLFEENVNVENIALFQTEDKCEGRITVRDQEYPFCCQIAGVQFVSVTSFAGSELAQSAFLQELRDWMWTYLDTPPDYSQYLVLDCVYPFMDAEYLLEKINVLVEEEVPYVISVMPIYENTSYPAMVQFCQVLRYAQQNGGFIIMHAPIIHAVNKDKDELYEVLTEGLNAYLENGVYPLGIEVPISWTFDDYYLEILKRYQTVFVYNDEESSGFKLDAGYNKLVFNYHQLVMPVIPLDKTEISYLTCYSAAIYLDSIKTDTEHIREVIEIIKNERIPFQDLWALNHSVWANDIYLNYEDNVLYLNDKIVEITYEPIEYDEEYDYNRDIIQRITISLKNQNKALIILTAVIVVLFTSLIAYLRINNRRSFFYKDE